MPGRATMSLPGPALPGPAISFAAGLLGGPNAQIWMADVLIGLEPNAPADRRLGARLSRALRTVNAMTTNHRELACGGVSAALTGFGWYWVGHATGRFP